MHKAPSASVKRPLPGRKETGERRRREREREERKTFADAGERREKGGEEKGSGTRDDGPPEVSWEISA